MNSPAVNKIEELLMTIVNSIVSDTENVSVTKVESDSSVFFEVTASKVDAGKLIGTKGRVAESIRTIIKTSKLSEGLTIMLNISNKPLEESR